MRNLKKLLALVLAMAMAFSLMLSAGAVSYSDYPDKDSITAEFDEAVQVLTGLKVMQGDERGFRPSDKITRAEAAAIIYRAVTGDVDDKQSGLYADYGTFSDVNRNDWFAGYVGYCQNAGYIKGTTPTTFNPYGQVTGYEALAMILRAVGYGKNNEFTGSSWQVNVAAMGRELGVTRNVRTAHMEETLTMAAPREVVADLIFMTIATVPMVTYTPALAYNDKDSIMSSYFNATLGQQTFGLWYNTAWKVADDWGRPGYSWYQNGTRTSWTTTENGKGYVIPERHPLYSGTTTGNLVATIVPDADYETTEQVRECDVAEALGFGTAHNFDLYVNSKQVVAEDYQVVATDTVTKVGGTGRVTEFYYEKESRWFTEETDVAVMIDTMLALVTGKTDAKLDPAGHVITPAKLEVTVYDGNSTTNDATVSANAVSNRIISKPSNSKDNWTEYNKGDYILIHAYTNKTNTGGVWGNNISRNTQALKESAAFETNKVVDTTTGYPANTLVEKSTAWVEKVAESVQGKQTVTYWNQGKHQIDGKDYNDQICLFLDAAGRNTNTTFNWFFDLYGNIIGIADAKAHQYGVITNVYAAFGTGENDTNGNVKAVASVKFADGTTGTVTIDKFLMSYDGTLATAAGASSQDTKAATQLTAAANTIELRPVYDTVGNAALSVTAPNPTFSTANVASAPGWIYMAPSTVTNRNNHFAGTSGAGNATTSWDFFGILYDHMFQFTTASDNSVVAIEVAGSYAAGSLNSGAYANKFNALMGDADNNGTVENATNVGAIYKNLGFITNDVGATSMSTTANPGNATVWVDDETQIMVRPGTGMNDSTPICYNGVSALPGNVELAAGSQIDWADTDGDGRAEYVYVTGNVKGVITYGLFYYNGGAAQWNGTTGTMEGYLNGEATTLSFNSYSLFSTINNSVATYDGHLFAIQQTEGVVSAILQKDFDNGGDSTVTGDWTVDILMYMAATGGTYSNTTGSAVTNFAGFKVGTTFNAAVATPGTTSFVLGANGGNTYSTTTSAVYYKDLLANSTTGITVGTPAVGDETNLSYVSDSQGNRILVFDNSSTTVAKDAYWIAPTAKIIGELEWLNTRECDVTIVYENAGAKSAVQIYITPDPDVTPDVPSTKKIFTAGVQTLDTTGMTSANLLSILQGMGPKRVVYAPDLKAVAADLAAPENLLYFPYTVANGTAVSLTITNSSNAVVYFETGSASGAGTGQCFRIDMSGAHVATGATIAENLTAGTYTYRIVNTATGAELSSGSFTLA